MDLQNSEESTYQPDWKIGNLITGDTFYLAQHFGREHFGAQMKIFKIHTNGTLERFQTIEPEFIPEQKFGKPLSQIAIQVVLM